MKWEDLNRQSQGRFNYAFRSDELSFAEMMLHFLGALFFHLEESSVFTTFPVLPRINYYGAFFAKIVPRFSPSFAPEDF